ncbi:hypothetical protein ACIBG8_54565 [Nonomuraea sp. NPDC050556]|uniref:hypothetical protein n=1 Tax=Nonomuraea sp. NPDC050556 TaxID=3364369 RepID=UPI0037BA7130
MIALSGDLVQVLELAATGHLYTNGCPDPDLNVLLCAFLLRRERPTGKHGHQRLVLTRAGREALASARAPV